MGNIVLRYKYLCLPVNSGPKIYKYRLVYIFGSEKYKYLLFYGFGPETDVYALICIFS